MCGAKVGERCGGCMTLSGAGTTSWRGRRWRVVVRESWSWRAAVVAVGQSGGDGGDDDDSSIVRALTSVRLPFLPPALPAFLGALADFLEGVLAILRVGVLSCVSNSPRPLRAVEFMLAFPSILIGPEQNTSSCSLSCHPAERARMLPF